MDSVRDAFGRAGLIRSRNHRMLGGVAAGLGRRVGFEPGVSRLMFVLALLLIPGSQLLVYPVFWFCMPLEAEAAAPVWTAQPAAS
jgi:phage shock protein PspC (stress-responsive transcriptional regulator)